MSELMLNAMQEDSNYLKSANERQHKDTRVVVLSTHAKGFLETEITSNDALSIYQ